MNATTRMMEATFKILETMPALGITFTPDQIKGMREHLATLRLKHPLESERWDRLDALVDGMAAKHIDSL